MTVEPMLETDSPEVLRLALAYGPPPAINPEANGIVVRDGPTLRAAAVLRDSVDNYVVIDGLWPEKSRAGNRAMTLLTKWLETAMTERAKTLQQTVRLSAVVRGVTPKTDALMAKRGYGIIALVRAKEFYP